MEPVGKEFAGLKADYKRLRKKAANGTPKKVKMPKPVAVWGELVRRLQLGATLYSRLDENEHLFGFYHKFRCYCIRYVRHPLFGYRVVGFWSERSTLQSALLFKQTLMTEKDATLFDVSLPESFKNGCYAKVVLGLYFTNLLHRLPFFFWDLQTIWLRMRHAAKIQKSDVRGTLRKLPFLSKQSQAVLEQRDAILNTREFYRKLNKGTHKAVVVAMLGSQPAQIVRRRGRYIFAVKKPFGGFRPDRIIDGVSVLEYLAKAELTGKISESDDYSLGEIDFFLGELELPQNPINTDFIEFKGVPIPKKYGRRFLFHPVILFLIKKIKKLLPIP